MANQLQSKITQKNRQQLEISISSKRGRVNRIAKYRALYNVSPERMLRVRYDAPLPIFPGMVDTLNADLNDNIGIKYIDTDPADWLAAQKATAAAQKLSESEMPGAQWNSIFRAARKESILTGRGILKYSACDLNGKFNSNLENITFEDFHFEPKGGPNLEKHIFVGQSNIWLTKYELEQGAKGGVYDRAAVNSLLSMGNSESRDLGTLNYSEASRFRPLGIDALSNDWVGEPMYCMVEMVSLYEGKKWYNLFDYNSGISIRFCKLSEINSSELLPWFSFATHADDKNFASKAFADDLYPHAVTIADLFNEDMENRRLRNSNARGYDKDMFPNPQKLYEAQIGRSKLVPVDTKGGTRRISDGVYEFTTPQLTGTIDMISWLENDLGKNLGVNDLQMGASQPATKKVGVTYVEMANIGKRLSFMSQPINEAVIQLGYRVFNGFQDYLKEPLSIRLFGENGYEWDELRRIDLNTKREFEITVVSESQTNLKNEAAKASRKEALTMTAGSPNVNSRVRDELIFRDIGGYTEAEIARLMDTQTNTTKDSIAIASAAIQEIMRGKEPAINHKADGYFLEKILEFVETNQEDPKVAKKYRNFLAYIQRHEEIARANNIRREQKKIQMIQDQQIKQGLMSDKPEAPEAAPNQFQEEQVGKMMAMGA